MEGVWVGSKGGGGYVEGVWVGSKGGGGSVEEGGSYLYLIQEVLHT